MSKTESVADTQNNVPLTGEFVLPTFSEEEKQRLTKDYKEKQKRKKVVALSVSLPLLAVVVALVIVLSIVLTSGIFHERTLKKISLGITADEAKNVLGEPDDERTTKLCYYDNGDESTAEKSIVVKLSEGKVTEVAYNADMKTDFEDKRVKTVKLDFSNVHYVKYESYYNKADEGAGVVQVKLSSFEVKSWDGSNGFWLYYEDGSIRHVFYSDWIIYEEDQNGLVNIQVKDDRQPYIVRVRCIVDDVVDCGEVANPYA